MLVRIAQLVEPHQWILGWTRWKVERLVPFDDRSIFRVYAVQQFRDVFFGVLQRVRLDGKLKPPPCFSVHFWQHAQLVDSMIQGVPGILDRVPEGQAPGSFHGLETTIEEMVSRLGWVRLVTNAVYTALPNNGSEFG